MNMSQLFTVLTVVSIVVGLFIFIMDEQKVYTSSDYSSEEIENMSYVSDIREAQMNIYDKFKENLGAESTTEIGLLSGVYITYTLLTQIANVIYKSLLLLPNLTQMLLSKVLPAEISSIINSALYSLIIILLIFKLIKFVIGKE